MIEHVYAQTNYFAFINIDIHMPFLTQSLTTTRTTYLSSQG